MKIIKSFAPQDLRIVEVPMPEPGAGQVRIKVKASGICGSDKWVWYYASDNIAGHEVAGEIDKLGEGVHDFAIGDRVMVNNVGGCGICLACRGGAFVNCPSWDGSLDVNNGFGEYIVAPTRNCMRILPGLDFIDGALIMDNWGTPYGGIMRGQVKPGMDVLVNGCGPIGQAAVALCTSMGAYVIAVDPIEWRRNFALKNGAKAALSPDEMLSTSRKITQGKGIDVVLECSGNGPSYDNCLKSLRNEGTLVVLGEEAELNLNASPQILRRSPRLVGSWYSTMPQGAEVMQLASQGRINLKCFLTHTVSLEEVPSLFGPIINCEDGIMKCVVVFD